MYQNTLECMLTMIIMEIDDSRCMDLGRFLVKVGAGTVNDPMELAIAVRAKLELINVKHISNLLLRHKTINMELLTHGKKPLKKDTIQNIFKKASYIIDFKRLEQVDIAMHKAFIRNDDNSVDITNSGTPSEEKVCNKDMKF